MQTIAAYHRIVMTTLTIETSQGLVIAVKEHTCAPQYVVFRDGVYKRWTSIFNEDAKEYIQATYRATTEANILVWDDDKGNDNDM